MARILLVARKARDEGMNAIAVMHGPGCELKSVTAEARTVAEAEAALGRFAVDVANTLTASADHTGVYLCANWPIGERKPAGWDAAAYKERRLRRYLPLPVKGGLLT